MPDTVNQKISELPSASTPGNNDVLAGVQSSTTKKFAFSSIKAWIQGWIAKSDVGLSNVANVLQYSASNKPTAADVTYSGSVGGVTVSNVKDALDYAPSGSDAIPSADASPGLSGISSKWSRSDHVHPSDPAKVSTSRRINNATLTSDLVLFWGMTLTFPLSWSGAGPYTNTSMTISEPLWAGLTAKSRVSLQPTAAQIAQLQSDGVTALTIENNAGTLTAYALGAAPTTAMTIACTVTEVET